MSQGGIPMDGTADHVTLDQAALYPAISLPAASEVSRTMVFTAGGHFDSAKYSQSFTNSVTNIHGCAGSL